MSLDPLGLENKYSNVTKLTCPSLKAPQCRIHWCYQFSGKNLEEILSYNARHNNKNLNVQY